MLESILYNLETRTVYCSLIKNSKIIVNKTDIIIGKKWLERQKELDSDGVFEIKILDN